MYEKLKVGDEYRPVTLCISRDLVSRYLRALDEQPLTKENVEMEKDITVPPSIVSVFQKDALADIGFAGIVHAKQEYDFLSPIHIDDNLTTSTRILGKYVKKGKKWFVTELTTKNDSGEIVAIGKSWAICP